jgi:antitoxin component YwqK of YwqJK toxin-antitoxin module
VEEKFKDGQLEGITKTYYESGQLEWEGNYKDGKREGIGREYYQSGQLKEEAYIMNRALISQKKYDENGNLESD